MLIFLIGILTLLAAFIGTISGFGLSTIMLPIALIFMPLPVALLLVGIIHFFTEVWRIILFKKGFDKKLLIFFGIPGIITSFVGAKIVLNFPEHTLIRILGFLLIGYVSFLIFEPKFKIPNSPSSSVIGGLLSGIMAGIFGTGGAVRSAFLTAYNLPKEVYLFASGAIGVLVDTTRITIYLLGGVKLPAIMIFGLLLFIPATFLGASMGKKVVYKVNEKNFRRIISVFLFLIGLKLFVSP